MDEEKNKYYTGVSNKIILENIGLINSLEDLVFSLPNTGVKGIMKI